MSFKTANLLGTNIAASTMGEMSDEITKMAISGESSYVCFATAYMMMETTRNSDLQKAYAEATAVVPDGVPVAWFTRILGGLPAECISGPRLFPGLLRKAEEQELRVGFYGGRESTLDLMRERLTKEFPLLNLTYCFSPPFRSLTSEEQSKYLADIKLAGVQMLFIGLGSPKQDCWMNKNGPDLDCVSLGVGAAFEFFSKEKTLPPLWIQKLGLTWLVRLLQEPGRLFARNLDSLPFVYISLRWLFMNEANRKLWQERILQRLSHSVVRDATS